MNVRYNQSAEDYLECMLTLQKTADVVHRIDIAKRMGVSQAAVNKAIKLLFEKGYVYEEGKHLYLTTEGTAYAETVYEKHCAIKEYLVSIGVSPSTAEEDACKMEHLVSDETFAAMKRQTNK